MPRKKRYKFGRPTTRKPTTTREQIQAYVEYKRNKKKRPRGKTRTKTKAEADAGDEHLIQHEDYDFEMFNPEADEEDAAAIAADSITLATEIPSYLEQLPSFSCRADSFDAELVCADGVRVPCHRVVLASVSAFLGHCLSFDDGAETRSSLVMPDHHSDSVRRFLDGVYGCLGPDETVTTAELVQYQEVMQSLHVDFVPWSSLNPKVVLQDGTDDMDGKVQLYTGSAGTGDSTAAASATDPLNSSLNTVQSANVDADCFAEESKDQFNDFESTDEDEEEVVPAKKRRKVVMDHDDDDDPSSPDDDGICALVRELESQISSCEGELVFAMGTPYREEIDVKPHVAFKAALGVKWAEGGDGGWNATPLAWSPETELPPHDYFELYMKYSKALKEVFGLSDAEVHYHHARRGKMGFPERKYISKKLHYQWEMATFTPEQLRAVMAKAEEANLVTTSESKAPLDQQLLMSKGDVLSVKLTREMGDLDGVMMLLVDRSGRMTGHCFELDSEDRWQSVMTMVHALTGIWLLRTGRPRIPKCQEFMAFFRPLAKVVVRHEVAKSFLEDDADGSLRNKFLAEEACPICGVVFQLKTRKDRDHFGRHKASHKYLDHKCDCDEEFDTPAAKVRHVKLFHMEGFHKCELCRWVFPKTIAKDSPTYVRHMETYHQERTCEYCGAKYASDMRLREHLMEQHPNSGVVGVRKKPKKRRDGTCEVCGEHFTYLARHKRIVHGAKNTLCPLCGKGYTSKFMLKKHLKETHAQAEKTYKCPKCPNIYAGKYRWKRHYIGVHLKLLHQLCRYEGCDSRYSDSGSRFNHERLAHGRSYHAAAKLGLVPQKPKKNISEEYYKVHKELDELLEESLQEK